MGTCCCTFNGSYDPYTLAVYRIECNSTTWDDEKPFDTFNWNILALSTCAHRTLIFIWTLWPVHTLTIWYYVIGTRSPSQLNKKESPGTILTTNLHVWCQCEVESTRNGKPQPQQLSGIIYTRNNHQFQKWKTRKIIPRRHEWFILY
jgi:hypothetical protein